MLKKIFCKTIQKHLMVNKNKLEPVSDFHLEKYGKGKR
jgi:hypothetical protein